MEGLNLVKSSMLYVQRDEEEGKEIAKIVASTQSASLSPEVEKWRPMVQKYCNQYKI